MPRDVTVTFDSGAPILYKGVPDDVTPESVTARASSENPGRKVMQIDGGQGAAAPAPQPSSSWLNSTADFLKPITPYTTAAVRGVLGGVSGLLKLMPNSDSGPSNEGGQSAGNFLGHKLEDLTNQYLPPVDDGSRLGKKVIEGSTGALVGPGGLASKLVSGAAGTITSDLADTLTNGDPTARVFGNLLGSFGGAAATNRIMSAAPTITNLGKEALEGLPPGALGKAQAFQAEAKARGVDLDLAQALSSVGVPEQNLTQIRNMLYGNKDGNGVQQVLRNQPGQLSPAADMAIGNLPGTVRQPGIAANNLTQAATNTIQIAKADRGELWRQTLADTTDALKATENASVLQSQGVVGQQQAAVAQLRAQLTADQNKLAAASAGDASAVAAANATAEHARGLLRQLQDFTLPRGSGVSNTGRLLDSSGRGASIDMDQIARESAWFRGASNIPQTVVPAKSLDTLTAEGNVAKSQTALQGGEADLNAALDNHQAALARQQALAIVPSQAVDNVASNLDTLIAQRPNTGQSAALQQLRDSLYTGGKPITDPIALNEVLKTASARLKSIDLASSGLDAGTAKWVGGQIDNVRNQLGQSFAPIRAANTAFQTATNDTINPLKQGPVGTLAGRGYKADVQSPTSRMKQLFEAGTDPQASGVSDIRTAGLAINKVDPEAFADAAKTFYSGKVAQAFAPELGAATATNADAAQRLKNSLFDNGKQWQGMKDAASVLAEGQGLNPADVVRGLENFGMLVRGAANRPSGVGGMTSQDMAKIAGSSTASTLLRIPGIAPGKPIANWLDSAIMGKTYRTFDKILTTPEGAQMLEKLGQTSALGAKAQALFATWAAQQGAGQPASAQGQQ